MFYFDLILDFCCQAEAVLPPADAVILEVTPELLESATVISEQLVMATDSEEAVGLLPLDLNTTNSVVAQVRDTGKFYKSAVQSSSVSTCTVFVLYQPVLFVHVLGIKCP